jgi:hypothetical protein
MKKNIVIEFFNKKKPLLISLLFLNILIHLPFLSFPPLSIHTWKQCNIMATSRNFYEEDMNILKPRVDRRLDTDGVTGMHFPLYENLVAMLWKITGFNETVPRVFTLIIFSFCIWVFYELCFIIFRSGFMAAVGAWSLCWSPELFYHSINALPDILAFASALSGLYFFLKWDDSRKIHFIFWAILFTTIAGLTKLPNLIIGFPIAAIVIKGLIQKKYISRDFLLLALFALVSLGISFTWYFYSIKLQEDSGLMDFALFVKPLEDWTKALPILERNLISDMIELFLNFAGFALFCFGLLSIFKNKKWHSVWFIPVMAWIAGMLIHYLINLRMMDVHQYYLIPLFPVLFFCAALGANYLLEKKYTIFLVLLLCIQPVLAAIRIIPPRWINANKSEPHEFYNKTLRAELENATPLKDLIITGPEDSGCILFYFLHKKGFGFLYPTELLELQPNKKTKIKDYIDRGAKYLYTNNPEVYNNNNLKPYFGRTIKVVGSFRVIELKQ